MDLVQAQKTRWATYRTAYHLIWTPKYRRRIFLPDIQSRTKAIILTTAQDHGLQILEQETDEDHIHVFVSASPRWSPAMLAKLLKGATSRILRLEFPRLVRQCGRDQLWSSTYYVGTAGAVSMTIGVIRRLGDLTPDPDDADLDWAQGRQFITAPVAPSDLVWSS